MVGKKVEIALIEDHDARKACFRRRHAGLVKNLFELNTLCDATSAMIVYGPEGPDPVVWPSVDAARELVMRFKSTIAGKRAVGQERYLMERIAKVGEMIERQVKRNRAIAARHHVVLIRCGVKRIDELDGGEAEDLAWFLEEKKREVREKRSLSRSSSDSEMNLPAVFPAASISETMEVEAKINPVETVDGGLDEVILPQTCAPSLNPFDGLLQTIVGVSGSAETAVHGGDGGMAIANEQPGGPCYWNDIHRHQSERGGSFIYNEMNTMMPPGDFTNTYHVESPAMTIPTANSGGGFWGCDDDIGTPGDFEFNNWMFFQ